MAATFSTLAEQKARARERMTLAFDALQHELAAYARAHGGSFIVFGSLARGEHRFHSDVDLLVDFPTAQEASAWEFAEDACCRLALKPDIHLRRTCSPAFLAHIQPEMRSLP
jgi:predicted nucleotidyltransferase